MKFQIRQAIQSDYDTILSMWLALNDALAHSNSSPFGDSVTDEQTQLTERFLKNALENQQSRIFIAENEQPLGTIAVVQNKKLGFSEPLSAVIFNLWVDSAVRRRGIASALVGYVQDQLKQQGVTSVQVGWHPSEQTDGFWRAQGFATYEIIAAKKI